MERRKNSNVLHASRVTALDLDSNHGFGPVPEKRKKRAAMLSAALSFVIMVALLGAFTKPTSTLYIVTSNTTKEEDGGMRCKGNNEYYHVGIFIWSLNLVGIILGEFVHRFCLIFEEYFHLDTRYGGSRMKMFYACFNDISFRAVFFGSLVAFITIGSTLISQGTDYFKFEYIEIILSAVGSGSLVLYLLSLDSLSRVQVSSLMENNNRLVANGLAWCYYFGYLKLILPGLPTRIEESELRNILSSTKLFILMPRDCYAFGTLSQEDQHIELAFDNAAAVEVQRAGKVNKLFRNVVYRIKSGNGGSALYVLAEYATPLSSLYDMSHSAQVRLTPEDRDEQAKLFFRTLEAILKYPSVPDVQNKCKLVPYARNTGVPLSQVLAEAVLEDMKSSSNSSEISLDDLDGPAGLN